MDVDQKKLTLFYYSTCPYCIKVIIFMKTHRIKIAMKNIRKSPDDALYLQKNTGRFTVPCLQIGDDFLHESKDIIHWFKKNLL